MVFTKNFRVAKAKICSTTSNRKAQVRGRRGRDVWGQVRVKNALFAGDELPVRLPGVLVYSTPAQDRLGPHQVRVRV